MKLTSAKFKGLKKKLEFSLLIILLCVLAFNMVKINLLAYNNHFTELAWSFSNGHTYFLNPITEEDTVLKDGHRFWPQPPFPAIVLIPLTLLQNKVIEQTAVTFVLNILNFILIYFLARR